MIVDRTLTDRESDRVGSAEVQRDDEYCRLIKSSMFKMKIGRRSEDWRGTAGELIKLTHSQSETEQSTVLLHLL